MQKIKLRTIELTQREIDTIVNALEDYLNPLNDKEQELVTRLKNEIYDLRPHRIITTRDK